MTTASDRPRSRSKDLFEQSTMTFGQHLEELRTCLFKAVGGLFVGVLIGFPLGGPVVKLVEKPLSDALEDYYQKRAIDHTTAMIERLKSEGKAVPTGSAEIQQLILKQQLLPEEYFVDPTALVSQLKVRFPHMLKDVEVPQRKAESEMSRSDFLPLLLWHPLEQDNRVRPKSFGTPEAFSVYMKASLMVGVVIAAPWILYQLWIFIGAGLYPHEKRYVYVFLPFSLMLFLIGAGMTFFLVFKPVLSFFLYFNSVMGIEPDPRITEWMGFVFTLPLGFGVAFQLPLVMLFLERIHVFSVKSYLSFWRVAVLAIAVIALLLTPDPSSMMLMVVPLVGLYFGGIALCRYMPRLGKPHDFQETM